MSTEQPTIETLQRQVAALQARVAELEQSEQRLRIFKQIADRAPIGVTIVSLEGNLTYGNAAWADMIASPDGKVGRPLLEVVVEEERTALLAELSQIKGQGSGFGEWTAQRANGETFPVHVSSYMITDEQGHPLVSIGLVRDMSEQQRADEERLALQEQVIEAQQAALREVSTPLIPLADDVVVMPLVGAIDSARAQQIMEVLLEGIANYQADTVLLDISGVRVVDTQVADALLRSARAAQLLGAQIILTGISADVAQTIVHLGADIGQIMTRANLRDGLHYALEERSR